jgi:hypothetical protein
MKQTFTFLYTGGISTLSFFAVGGPSGEPPLVLLDGVTLYDVPEPAAWTAFLTGALALALYQISVARTHEPNRAGQGS